MQILENHVIWVFKITLYLYASPNLQILRHEKVSYFELSALSLADFGLNLLYLSLSCNHSNPKFTRMYNMFLGNCG